MENSTKALLIAASVLIAIVLISVGIKLLSSTSGVAEEVGSVSDSMAVSIFNSQFTSFFSNSTSGIEVKNLITKTISTNATTDHKVMLNFYPKTGSNITHKKDSAGLQSIYNKIVDTSKYKIGMTSGCGTYSGGYNNGYVACISIHEK